MQRPGVVKMLVRGLFRRCAWCGGKGFFTGWFSKRETCATCGLHWRRGDVGYELGAASITAVLVGGPLVIVIGIMTAVMWPDVDVVPMFIVLTVMAILLPPLMYASSYTVWQVVDILLRPPEPGDFDVPESVDEHR